MTRALHLALEAAVIFAAGCVLLADLVIFFSPGA